MIGSTEVVLAVRRVTLAGMVVNIALAAAKAVVGLTCASQALVADAVHSVSDLVTDVAVLLGVRYWTAPADERHPYGHGKIEALVTVFIAFGLAGVACELASNAAARLQSAKSVSPPGIAAAGLAFVSVVAKEALFRWTRRVARRVKSSALESNAWHHRSDALSSVPVAVVVVIARFFPSLAWLDAVGALLVVVFIFRAAWQLAKPAFEELVDASIEGKAEAVAAVARKVSDVKSVHKARARRYGSAYQADIHVMVDPSLTITEGHAVGHAVKDAVINAGIDVDDVVVHVEPALGKTDEPSGASAQLI